MLTFWQLVENADARTSHASCPTPTTITVTETETVLQGAATRTIEHVSRPAEDQQSSTLPHDEVRLLPSSPLSTAPSFTFGGGFPKSTTTTRTISLIPESFTQTPTSSPSPTDCIEEPSSSDSSSSAGKIVGSVLGSISAIAVLIALLLWFCKRKRKLKITLKRKQGRKDSDASNKRDTNRTGPASPDPPQIPVMERARPLESPSKPFDFGLVPQAQLAVPVYVGRVASPQWI